MADQRNSDQAVDVDGQGEGRLHPHAHAHAHPHAHAQARLPPDNSSGQYDNNGVPDAPMADDDNDDDDLAATGQAEAGRGGPDSGGSEARPSYRKRQAGIRWSDSQAEAASPDDDDSAGRSAARSNSTTAQRLDLPRESASLGRRRSGSRGSGKGAGPRRAKSQRNGHQHYREVHRRLNDAGFQGAGGDGGYSMTIADLTRTRHFLHTVRLRRSRKKGSLADGGADANGADARLELGGAGEAGPGGQGEELEEQVGLPSARARRKGLSERLASLKRRDSWDRAGGTARLK